MAKSVAAVFGALMVAVAGAAAPLGLSPIRRRASKHKQPRLFLTARRIARGSHVMHKIFGNNRPFAGAGGEEQCAEHARVRQAQLDPVCRGDRPMRKKNRRATTSQSSMNTAPGIDAAHFPV